MNAIKAYLSAIGARGGASGKGASKRRSKEHYQRAALAMHAKRKAKAGQ
jgi:hypothetical protein